MINYGSVNKVIFVGRVGEILESNEERFKFNLITKEGKYDSEANNESDMWLVEKDQHLIVYKGSMVGSFKYLLKEGFKVLVNGGINCDDKDGWFIEAESIVVIEKLRKGENADDEDKEMPAKEIMDGKIEELKGRGR